MYSATALWEFSILEPWMKQYICCRSWLKKEGRVLPKAEYWPVCHNTGVNPEFSVSRVPPQDEYCHNEGPDLVYRPQGERYIPQYTCKRSGRVSVHCWGRISNKGAGVFHRIEGHQDGLHYLHILQNVTVPSVWVLYPNGIIHLQQDHFSFHDCRVVHEWLSQQADVKLLDWPLRAPDMNPIKKRWSEVKRTMQETWPVPPPTNSDELWALVSNAWDEVAVCTRYIRSMTWQMKSEVKAEGFWNSY